MAAKMTKISIYNSSLKNILCAVSVTALVACSSASSDDWPLLAADPLWAELEETRNSEVANSDLESAGTSNPSLSKSPYEASPELLLDVRVTLDEVERDLPYLADNMAKAMDLFDAAAEEDKALYWRGVEIEKSRINELSGKLRTIEYQIANNDHAAAERQLARVLLARAEEITPDAPDSLDLALMQQAEATSGTNVFDNQMVVAANPYAAKAGLEILNKGGSAVDAAIAVETVLSLVEPQSSGIGGGGFMLHFDPTGAVDNQLAFYDGRETAPMEAGPDLFKEITDREGYTNLEAVFGGRSVGTPGVLAMLKMAHDNHGVLPWAEVFEPAIRIAQQGFIVSPRLERYITIDTVLMKIPAARDYFYDKNGDPWKAGHLLKNPKHEAVLRRIANEGIDAFYKGELAEKIVDAVRNAPFNPGLLALSDLENYQAKQRDVLCGPFRIYKVCSISSPSSGGSTTIAALGMLKEYDLGEMEPHSPEAYHLMLEAERLAYADRNQFSGDSDFVYVPIHGMIDPDYLAERAKLIDPNKSMGIAEHGNPPTDRDAPLELGADASLEIPSTTHFVIIDKWGHAVSMTATVESFFGSRVMVEGFMLNNELTDFSLLPVVDGKLVNNRVQPGKRPRSTMSPTITFDNENRPVLVVGSPGGSNIIDYVTQTIINVLDWDMNIQDAINQPHVLNKNGPTLVEEGTSAEALMEPLRALGHEVNAAVLMSGLHGIRIKYANDNERTLEGGADPRREGYVAQ